MSRNSDAYFPFNSVEDLRNKRLSLAFKDRFSVQAHPQKFKKAGSNVWNQFSLICFEGKVVAYVCECDLCHAVFRTHSQAGVNIGTNTLKEHLKSCIKNPRKRTLDQALRTPVSLSSGELKKVKRALSSFVVRG